MKNTQRQRLRKGTILLSFFLFPALYFYFSPVIILEAAAKGIMNGSAVIFILLFISALTLGRAWCGWLCPAAGCQEALFDARDDRVMRGDFLKWLIWIPWIGTIVYLVAAGGGYRHIDFLYQTTYGLSIDSILALCIYYIVLLLLIVLPALTVGRRSFCHHLCWMAPFLIIGRKVGKISQLPGLQLKADNTGCKHCRKCTRVCPMSLPVECMVTEDTLEHTECILCGSCVDSCPEQVLKYRYGRLDRS